MGCLCNDLFGASFVTAATMCGFGFIVFDFVVGALADDATGVVA
jgi:hypothetical protein